MTQKRQHSLLEVITSTVLGFIIAVVTQIVIFPLFGVNVSLNQHIFMTLIFTIISTIRAYYVRRLFNYLHTKEIL